ncbi:hypothetical protein LSH36_35g08027 [Paralvinella palmiformis]|uniref:Uncharacterized protein n=1 Tax=Paralvinella palmiformis TaxID=53620 RepID=A0AAD9KAD3_9ANNE|nr:hypothetical protein LSH36_35g08027 [Paralvinella palmiformis]
MGSLPICPCLPTPPASAQRGMAAGSEGAGNDEAATGRDSPDYLPLNREIPASGSAAAPVPVMREISRDGQRAPDTGSDSGSKKGGAPVESGEKSETCDSDGDVSTGAKKHVTVYAIGGTSD